MSQQNQLKGETNKIWPFLINSRFDNWILVPDEENWENREKQTGAELCQTQISF